MSKKHYTINSTVACWVTYTASVTADSEAEATEKFRNGQCDNEESSIGDSLDHIEPLFEITEDKP